MKTNFLSRGQFLKTAAAAVAGIAIGSEQAFGFPAYIKNLGKPNSKFNGVQVGVISYSWRSMPGSAVEILKYCLDCNISALELMGPAAEEFAGAPVAPKFTNNRNLTPEQQAQRTEYNKKMVAWRESVPMRKFEQLGKMYKNAGVSIYAYKPSALGTRNTDKEADYAFRAARALGASHVTVELPKEESETQRLGKIALANKIYVGYHGHLQQTITAWDVALSQSQYNAINFDMGHYVAAGFDPIAFLETKNSKIVSMHVKDRKSKVNGGANVPWGEGDTPLIQALQFMRKNKCKFPATIELEYDIPAGSDAVKETAKCVEFARKALESKA